MLFTDHLYGTIDFRGTPYADLIYELLGCPEVQRLRHMRLMNFDVPYIQDLATTRRYPHSIGTCYLAYKTVEKTPLPLSQKKAIIAAALIHDIGILPYGHLLESIIKFRIQNSFSHERIVHSILNGTYHSTNKYHQILPDESLRLSKVLKQNNLSTDQVYNLICPPKGSSTAISADVDLDNLDNVHRMASLLGYKDARDNLLNISDNITIDKNLKLIFSPLITNRIERWLEIRQKIYTMIIAHPECVPYNAFLSQLLHSAVDNKVITTDQWYLTDQLLELELLKDESTKDLAKWLFSRPQYELVDYVWLTSLEKASTPLQDLEKKVVTQKFDLPKKSDYFFWSENKLISREVTISLKNGETKKIGINSSSILISLISKTDYNLERIKVPFIQKQNWRKQVINFVEKNLSDWAFEPKFPEDYTGDFISSKLTHEQLKLFN